MKLLLYNIYIVYNVKDIVYKMQHICKYAMYLFETYIPYCLDYKMYHI